MKKINLKGIDAKSVTGIVVLLVALVNAILQMIGMDTLPIKNDEISNVVSMIFLFGSAAYTTYKNFNVSEISQVLQKILNGVKSGKISVDDVKEFADKLLKTE